MSEDINKKFYLKAEKEFNSDKRDEALWVQSLSINQGNESKAKFTYIELRVQELNPNVKTIVKNYVKKEASGQQGEDNIMFAVIFGILLLLLLFSL